MFSPMTSTTSRCHRISVDMSESSRASSDMTVGEENRFSRRATTLLRGQMTLVVTPVHGQVRAPLTVLRLQPSAAGEGEGEGKGEGEG